MRILIGLFLVIPLFSQPGMQSVLATLPTTPNAPTDSPGAGSYSSTQSVTLSDPTATTIWYTTDGTTPQCCFLNGTLYSGAFNISATTTLKAIGCNGRACSSVLTSVYTINSSTPPSNFAGFNGTASITGSFTFDFSAITTTSGQLLYVTFGAQASDCSTVTSVTSTIGGSSSGDTFTRVPNSSLSSVIACGQSWIAYGVHAGSANYVITAHGSASTSFSSMKYVGITADPGTLTATDGAGCSGTSTSTSISCSSSITPSGSLGLVLSGAFSWDTGSGFTSSYGTIPSGGSSTGSGAAAVQYKILNPTAGAETPAFTGPSGGDGMVMTGMLVK